MKISSNFPHTLTLDDGDEDDHSDGGDDGGGDDGGEDFRNKLGRRSVRGRT